GVDIELADAVQRLRFEHPEVGAVLITSALDGVFSSGANIFMLGLSTHAHKVNFCKYTNETRLYIEDASEFSGQRYIAGLNGIASGGGYELPMACEEIYLVDDRRSAVSLPEVPFLGVLPGTGGLTRLVDKRKVRRDLADVFSTLAEGIKGKRAVEWGLVDGIYPTSRFADEVDNRLKEAAQDADSTLKGISLDALNPKLDAETGSLQYRHVSLKVNRQERVATLRLTVPSGMTDLPSSVGDLGADWFALRAFRELDDAILRLRFHYPEVGLVLIETKGDAQDMLSLDAAMDDRKDDWFVRETLLFMKRVMKRIDCTARSFFAIIDEGSCFTGSLFELALAADRIYMLEEEGVQVEWNASNHGAFPMANGLTRLQTRFLADPAHVGKLSTMSGPIDTDSANELGLVTVSADDIDWEDEVRLAIEERVSLSPDSLTGMEANLRFAGPETMETKIFGRLSAWQNWIFQRPNAVGPSGALSLYGQPASPEFDYNRT
ncbi:MAG: benzoyl-CoA-dihydrodiol lyase, partial [Planctomycetes bacterium]|nr:benzoyl-CoA-dihydrodiol lyase [Planctomycetota bacterium]